MIMSVSLIRICVWWQRWRTACVMYLIRLCVWQQRWHLKLLLDLLQIAAPLAVIGGHTKAVSYVRWAGGSQVISASTDNHLKLWDVADAAITGGNCQPITSFSGTACNRLLLASLHQHCMCFICVPGCHQPMTSQLCDFLHCVQISVHGLTRVAVDCC